MLSLALLSGRLLFSITLLLATNALSAALIDSVEVRGTRRQVALETQAGDPFRAATIDRDVRRLWKTGNFADIRVESSEGDPVRVVFRVVERPRFVLRDVRFDPPGERRKLSIEQGDSMTEQAARAAGQGLAEQLVSEGFPGARVEARLAPAGAGQADLEVRVDRGSKVRFAKVDVEGDLALDAARVRSALQATAARRWLPGIPGVWKGWVRRAPYSPGRIESDLAALRSLYITEGYLAATVTLQQVRIAGNQASVALRADAGPRYRIDDALIETPGGRFSIAAAPLGMVPGAGRSPAPLPLDRKKLCGCLLEERSKAEREGRLDFTVRVEWEPADQPAGKASTAGETTAEPEALQRRARLIAHVEPGAQYHVGRIEFRGNNKLRDTTLRRALAIDEGDWLMPGAIRASIDRLSRIEMIEDVSESDVHATPAGPNTVDLTIAVRERQHGRWSVSGPLGPVSWFGPLRFAIDTRLPPWGRGILDLSTWLGTFGVLSYTDPVMQILSGETKGIWLPFAALHRPLLPGQELTSGFLLSPSLGWKDHLLYAGLLHARSAADTALAGGYRAAPLAATYGRRDEDAATVAQPGILLCKPRTARLDWLRSGAKMLLDLAMGAS
jgi:Surface antigen variable number repeat